MSCYNVYHSISKTTPKTWKLWLKHIHQIDFNFSSRCGYKDGGSSPWCYVGNAGSDQWRPCKINSFVNP